MKKIDLPKLLRPHIAELKPYSSARDEFSGTASIYLDANENPYHSVNKENYNRYPDPYQWKLKEKISKIKSVSHENIFLGNGSDEPIDLIMRAFCRPGYDNIIITPPTYGMYEVSAGINDVEIRKVLLTNDFQIKPEEILNAVDAATKVIFICSPNNPSGNLLKREDILSILDGFDGIVVVDEAYIDFCPDATFIPELLGFENLIVLQTFSKAWGMAALRLGMAFASVDIIKILNKIKPPYNISEPAQAKALEMLKFEMEKNKMVELLINERGKLREELSSLDEVEKVYPSDANFLLVKMKADAKWIYQALVDRGIIVRDRSKVVLCDDCLRITVGTEEENQNLIKELKGILIAKS
jgi:histidinol-phosphate aminotransferase